MASVINTAGNHADVKLGVLRQLFKFFIHLKCQLTGRGHYQHPAKTGIAPREIQQILNCRQHKGQGFAGAGGGAGQHITAVKRRRDSQLLN